MTFLNELKEEIDFIYNNEFSFISVFLKNKNVIELYNVSFDDENLYISWVAYDGTHMTKSIYLRDYIEWRNNFND